MKIKFQSNKFLRLKDYFNIGWYKNCQADFSFNITLFGRENCWDFYKKDSEWIGYYDGTYDEWEQA
jgi:uncharacterized protein YozE (UPF0346 family)